MVLKTKAAVKTADGMHWPVKYALPEVQLEGWDWRFPIKLAVWAALWICAILLLFEEPLSALARHYHVDFQFLHCMCGGWLQH